MEVPVALVNQLNIGGCFILGMGPAGGAQQLVEVNKVTDGSTVITVLLDDERFEQCGVVGV